MDGEFSVYQFFPDETYEEVLRFVDAETAMRTVVSLTQSLGGRLGTTAKVIITDDEDYTTFEWQHGKGVVFPTREDIAAGGARQLDK
jgi:hypothetical protein